MFSLLYLGFYDFALACSSDVFLAMLIFKVTFFFYVGLEDFDVIVSNALEILDQSQATTCNPFLMRKHGATNMYPAPPQRSFRQSFLSPISSADCF